MTDHSNVLKKLREIRAELGEKYGVSELGIFGSVARGEDTGTSDLDVLVEFDPTRPADFFILSALVDTLKERTGHEVDIITKRALAQKTRLKERVERDVIYV
jgi:predicted nucleotidyltransferase